MSDKELLELAAKAAGVEIYDSSDAGIKLRGSLGLWNPLTDDGDALRLAVKVGIAGHYERNAPPEIKIPRECGVAINLSTGHWTIESRERDQYAATRRAIVRAAAEIGRGL